MSCILCQTRRERRFCPAVHGQICAQCCGEQREITLDCPAECPYLQQARLHEKPRQLADFGDEIFPDVEVTREFLYLREHLLLGLSFAMAKAARTNRELNDRDMIAALQAMCSNQRTLVRSGLHVAPSTVSSAQASVIEAVEGMLKQYEDIERREAGQSSLKSGEKLIALVFLVRMALSRTSGRPKSRALVDFLLSQFPQAELGGANQAATPSLIIP